jgi:GNAT superfamily N-acetyltransferase
MDTAHVTALQRSGIAAWLRGLAEASPGATSYDADGVVAAVVPVCPERSVVNSVVYEEAERLGAALDDLARLYADAGVQAWTVWTPETDAGAISILESAGHHLDGEPPAMWIDLADAPGAEPGDLDSDDRATPAEVGTVNDLAYGFSDDGVGRAIASTAPADHVRFYRARVEGEVAAVLETIDVESDCVIAWVATLPRFRGRGLASRLMRRALAAARDRGLETSTLQASPMGSPVYERLGYRTAFRLRMYERRPAVGGL